MYELSLPLTHKLYRHHIQLTVSTEAVDNLNLHHSPQSQSCCLYVKVEVYLHSPEHCAVDTELGLQQHQEHLNCTTVLSFPRGLALLLTLELG